MAKAKDSAETAPLEGLNAPRFAEKLDLLAVLSRLRSRLLRKKPKRVL
jgi:hypothetical protein